ncbi:MAG: hypothetical protein ACREBV_10230, partial [Candidatus Zixiibacteriota bacterium]
MSGRLLTGDSLTKKETGKSMDFKQLVQKGQDIYDRRYKKDLEEKHHGEFVAIDVTTEDHYLGSTPDEAAQKAREANPGGFFHLIRIG